jgi:hypothetical protein
MKGSYHMTPAMALPITLPHCQIDHTQVVATTLRIDAHTTNPTAVCPSCHHVSNRVHSRSVRAALIAAIRQVFYERQFVDAANTVEADRVVFIAPAGTQPWISVYDEAIGDEYVTVELERVLSELSARLSTSAVGLSLANHALRMFLYRNGDRVDQFFSEYEFDDQQIPSEVSADVKGHIERWHYLLADGISPDDLREAWNQENLDRPEGIEQLARVLNMPEYQAHADWVDVEAGAIDENIFTDDAQVSILPFRLWTPPFYRRSSEAAPAFATVGGSVEYTATVRETPNWNGARILHTSFRNRHRELRAGGGSG